MDLYFVRHALAWERDDERWPDDGTRPLRPSGIRRFRSASRGLARIAPRPDAVWSSPFVRAVETAAILHDDAGWPRAALAPGLKESAPPAPLLRAIARARVPAAKSLALVGHTPNLDRCIALAVGRVPEPPVRLKKGGVACVRFDGPVRPGGGWIVWVATPRMLRALED